MSIVSLEVRTMTNRAPGVTAAPGESSATLKLSTNYCLLRKYICGVVPSILRNISINALTLS